VSEDQEEFTHLTAFTVVIGFDGNISIVEPQLEGGYRPSTLADVRSSSVALIETIDRQTLVQTLAEAMKPAEDDSADRVRTALKKRGKKS